METYDLMLEGSGILAFDDGTQQAALFAGLNGHSGQSMAGYLIRSGELPRNKASMKGIRQWWDNHPQKRRAFLNASSGYVFFRFRCRASERDGGLRTDAVGQHGGRSARPAAWRHRFLRASGTAAGHPERARLRTRYRRRDPFTAHRHVHRGRRRRPPSGHDHLQSGAGLAVVGETVSLPRKGEAFPPRGSKKPLPCRFSARLHALILFLPAKNLAQNTETEGGSPPGLGAEVRLLKKRSELW